MGTRTDKVGNLYLGKDATAAWHQQAGESAWEFMLFLRYVKQEPQGRSIDAVIAWAARQPHTKRKGPITSGRSIQDLAGERDWSARARAYDAFRLKLDTDAMQDSARQQAHNMAAATRDLKAALAIHVKRFLRETKARKDWHLGARDLRELVRDLRVLDQAHPFTPPEVDGMDVAKRLEAKVRAIIAARKIIRPQPVPPVTDPPDEDRPVH